MQIADAKESELSIPSIKQLSTKNRHRVRAILNKSMLDAKKIFNLLRENAGANEIYCAEVLLSETPYQKFKVPDIFPNGPQVRENHHRLASLGLEKQAALIEVYARRNLPKLIRFCNSTKVLNHFCLQKEFDEVDKVLSKMKDEFGFSHFLLRKACWVKSEISESDFIPAIDSLLKDYGIGEKNVITTSVVNCFSESQDYLALRKSILAIQPKGYGGAINRFTRDLARLVFQPHANNGKDFCELLQSMHQSSLIDALILFKINKGYLSLERYPSCNIFFSELEKATLGVDVLAEFYLKQEDSEGAFFQKTGAWLESDEIIEYRLLNDFFYDPVIGTSLNTDPWIIKKCSDKCKIKSLSELVSNSSEASHERTKLADLKNNGFITRTSEFNFILFKNQGYDSISQEQLLWLMGKTRDLFRTINVEYAKRLISRIDSRLSKIIVYLLIVKRTRDDLSSNKMTRLLESEVIENYSADLTLFIDELGKKHESVAFYLHEICTEDFLARLTKIIPETKSIIDTRAKLHEWRGKKTGDRTFIDRARTIRIDYKISLVRGEIDDNRIYVDPSRFLDWVSDHILGDLTPVLTSLSHNINHEKNIDDPQLRDLITSCYFEFCANQHYGIASYIGRRIRHGTFKGHVFTNTLAFEKNYEEFLKDVNISGKYQVWRNKFEKLVSYAVDEKLHIETNVKKVGLIEPNLKSPAKEEHLLSCMSDLLKVFRNQGSTINLPTVLLEYCWRFVELDLLAIRNYIKEMKSILSPNDLSTDLKKSWIGQQNIPIAFSRELQTSLNNQFKMAQNWFKRPPSVAPKANINLLYKAVIKEVQETYPEFYTQVDYDEEDDLELFGEAYHRIYDAFFVIIFNAAKHGKSGAPLERTFLFEKGRHGQSYLVLSISSEIKEDHLEVDVASMLHVGHAEDIVNAQMHENRSGIAKLYNLTMTDNNLCVELIKCSNNKVTVALSYRIGN